MGDPYTHLKPGTIEPRTTADRIETRCVRDDNGCFVWQGAGDGPYGRISVRVGEGHRKLAYVHRVIFEARVRPLLDGEEIGHVCRNRRCCEVDHLYAYHKRIDILRMEA